ncbi:response regulator transcription factor [Actinosynnema sp. NPDC020468]|uniref:response regulator transcription factor n=1 Tax=Actinosynnema sp. NPDC020468 TaxID=3154488 RepID=UPI0033FE00BF
MTAVLADDSAPIRDALAELLAHRGFRVAARVGDAGALLAAVAAHRPDVAVVDVRVPPGARSEGLRAAVRIRREHPGTGVLVLSRHVGAHYLPALLDGDRGGVGYLLEHRVATAAFVDAVRVVATGGWVVDPRVVTWLGTARREVEALDSLTGRETEILSLMARGRSNRAIGRELVLAKKTVETHVRNILFRLDLPPGPDDDRRVLAVLTYLRVADGRGVQGTP